MAYEKEYGSDDVQISLDLFSSVLHKNKIYRFLIVDDLIATGGTVEAAVKIVNLLSKLYSFKYEVFILSLEEVPSLRTGCVPLVLAMIIVFCLEMQQMRKILKNIDESIYCDNDELAFIEAYTNLIKLKLLYKTLSFI